MAWIKGRIAPPIADADLITLEHREAHGNPVFTITNAAIHHLRSPSDRVIKTSWGVMSERHAIFIGLQSSDGIWGWGESWINFPIWSPWARLAAFEHGYFPYLKNRRVNNVRQFMAEMTRAFMGPAVQAAVTGATIAELCAVELAIWDLEAKSRGVPLSRLWFESPATEVEVYASGINSPLPWKDIDAMLERGVRFFKLKVGFGAEDLPNIKALTKYLADHGPANSRVAIDTNRHWTVDQALSWLPILRDHDILWLEEPLKPAEEVHYPRLRDPRSPHVVMLAAGENVWLPATASADTLVEFPVDILQPDITKSCSTAVALDTIGLARRKQKVIFPHYLGSAVGQAASIHLASGCSSPFGPVPLVEWDINPNPLRTDLLGPEFMIRNGRVKIPNEPGLGWPVDVARFTA